MSGCAFDSNIIIDLLRGFPEARAELERAAQRNRVWISRIVWSEVMSKGEGEGEGLRRAEILLSGFGVDEIDAEIGERAAAMRRERARLQAKNTVGARVGKEGVIRCEHRGGRKIKQQKK